MITSTGTVNVLKFLARRPRDFWEECFWKNFLSFNLARLMLPRCFSISRIIDKSSQETYGSGFLASRCGCHIVLVILPRLSKLADEVVGFLG